MLPLQALMQVNWPQLRSMNELKTTIHRSGLGHPRLSGHYSTVTKSVVHRPANREGQYDLPLKIAYSSQEILERNLRG